MSVVRNREVLMASDLQFQVRRQEPILVRPCKETPRPILSLSNLDDQESVRFHIPVVLFYRRNPDRDGMDPREAIKEALAKVLVHYYPFAGRMREAEDGKLCVDCTGQGVYFIAAEADVSLADFGDLKPPFPCWNDLLFDIPGSQSITETPLLLIQVTTLNCGGFILAVRMNHTISDGAGLVQFLTALGDMCYGAQAPAVAPIWKRRRLLQPRNPPQVTVPLDGYEQVQDQDQQILLTVSRDDEMCYDCFTFGIREIARLKGQPGVHGRISTFEILSACLWKLRTRSLKFPPTYEVRLVFPVDARRRLRPGAEKGYYGNMICYACAKAKAGEVESASLGRLAEVIGAAKEAVTDEYVRSVVDGMDTEIYRRAHHRRGLGSYLISDSSKLGLDVLDVGWGRPVYGGLARSLVSSFLIPRRAADGVTLHSIVVPVWLPAPAMASFRAELARLLLHPHLHIRPSL